MRGIVRRSSAQDSVMDSTSEGMLNRSRDDLVVEEGLSSLGLLLLGGGAFVVTGRGGGAGVLIRVRRTLSTSRNISPS
jgi:hypothetical protein